MPTTERSVLKTKPARHARGMRNYLQGLEKYVPPARFPDRGPKPASATTEQFWLLLVTVLSIPSLVFVLLYVLYVPGDLPKFLDFGLAGTLVLSGLFGASMTTAAFVMTMVVTLRGGISRKTQMTLWALAVLSLAGWMYVWVSFSILFQMSPLVPF